MKEYKISLSIKFIDQLYNKATSAVLYTMVGWTSSFGQDSVGVRQALCHPLQHLMTHAGKTTLEQSA